MNTLTNVCIKAYALVHEQATYEAAQEDERVSNASVQRPPCLCMVSPNSAANV
jgi:hypothetical protein